MSLTGTATATYNSKDVATATTVTFAGLSLSGSASGDYSLGGSTQPATITPKTLSYSGLSAPASKVYDGTTAAVVSGTGTLQTPEAPGGGSSADGKPYSGDQVSLTGSPTATYNSKDVTTATTVTFGGLSLSGLASGDYTLLGLIQAATITPKMLNYSGLSVPASKVYDGTSAAVVSGTGTLKSPEAPGSGSSADGKPYSGDQVSLSGTATATYNSKDVTTATTVTFAGLSLSGSASGDYSLLGLIQAATITPKALSYSGLSAPASKVYDGTTAAVVSGTGTPQSPEAPGSGNSADGKPYSSDQVSLTGTATATYNSKDVATAATVTFAGLSLSGSARGDYSLGGSTQPATITPKTLSYSGLSAPASKVYDGTTAAVVSGTVTLQSPQAPGSGSSADGKPYSGDQVSLSGTATATYNSKDVATATTVTVTGLSLSGSASGDYSLAGLTQAATITPKGLTASITGDPSKTYNGNATAVLTPANFSLIGLVPGDSFTVTQTVGTYATNDAATPNLVTASLVASDIVPGTGTLASDYSLPTIATGAGQIKKKTVSVVNVTAEPRVYNGKTSDSLNVSSARLSGVVSGDNVTLVTSGYSASFNNSNVGSNKPVSVTGMSLSGADAGDYMLQQPLGLHSTINQAQTQLVVLSEKLARNKHGQITSVTLSIHVEPKAPGGGVPTGKVAYEVNGTATLKSLTGALNTVSLPLSAPAKTIAITITYSGDPNFSASSWPGAAGPTAAVRRLTRSAAALPRGRLGHDSIARKSTPGAGPAAYRQPQRRVADFRKNPAR